MSFAAQLAERAAEKHRHRGRRRSSPSSSSSPPPPPSASSSSPPRPGRIVPRGRRVGGGRRSLPAAGKIVPRTPEKIIPRTPDGREREGGSPGGGTSRPGRFAAQLRRGPKSLNNHRSSNRSLPGRPAEVRGLNATPSRSASPSDDISDVSLSSARSTPLTTRRARSTKRRSLLPTHSARKDGGEEDDDEYDLVGFSLMSVPSAASVDRNAGGEGGGAGGGRTEGGEEEGGGSSPARAPRPSSPLVGGGDHWEQSPPPTPPSSNDEEDVADPPSFRGKDLSPIAPERRRESLELSSSSLSLPQLSSPQSFERTDPELQSKLHRQLLRCQADSEKSLTAQRQRQRPAPQSRGPVVGDAPSSAAPPDGVPDDDAVFGAWAEIESLRRRCQKAEDRARRERDRAERAGRELRLAKERGGRGATRREGGEGGDASRDAIEGVRSAASTDEPKEDATTTKENDSTAVDAHPVAPASADDERGSAQRDVAPHAGADAAADALRWKKRALEAEERLDRAAAATPPPPPPPRSEADESPDLIRLKNAEIDVLRHQVRRLEAQAREERARTDDLLRASSYLDGTSLARRLGGRVLDDDDDHPAVVVASECGSAAAGMGTGADEFRLLRGEIRHLQYQLRTLRNGGTDPTSAYSTTGESTLSSLDEGGNGDNYVVAKDDDRGEETEEEDGSNAQTSSGSSMWGLCCVRRSSRGYNRV